MSRHRRRHKTDRNAPAPFSRSDAPGVHPPEAPRPRLEPLDDIPDLPVTPQGAFELPNAPSEDLPPETREWVSRFLPTQGPGMSPWAGSDDAFEPYDEPVTPTPASASPSASPPTPAAAPARQAPVARSVSVAEEPDRAPAPVLASAAMPRGKRAGRRDAHRRGGSPVTAIAVAVAVLAVVALVIRERTRLAPASPGAVSTSAPAAPAVPASSDAVPKASKGTAQTPAPAAPKVGSGPTAHAPAVSVAAARAHAPSATTATTTAEATPPVVAAAPRFTLEVATFIFEDRAQAERDRLAAAGQDVSVRTEGQDGSMVYRVLLGRFASRTAANRAAEPLLSAGTVQQARVVRLPKPE